MNAPLRSRLALVVILSLSFAYGLLVVLVHVRESVVRSRSEAMYAEFLKLRLGDYEGGSRNLAQAVRRFSN